jgi:hypothetical protein
MGGDLFTFATRQAAQLGLIIERPPHKVTPGVTGELQVCLQKA